MTRIVDKGETITDCKSVANAFNQYFVNVGSELDKEIPRATVDYTNFMGSPNSNNFFLYPTCASEIEDEINLLANNKASGFFSIPMKILKLVKKILSVLLEVIFNNSLTYGLIPDCFKIAKVIPVYKKGTQDTKGTQDKKGTQDIIDQYHFCLYLINC